jgi:hypothetical protein
VLQKLNEERGISSVIVAICLMTFIGAAMLTLDSGHLWANRRMVITGTDAAVLDAAQMLNAGGLNPCTTADITAAETHATNVLTQNHPESLHNPVDTPDGFEVTLADPSLCSTASYIPGKVRYDGRLPVQGWFSKAFGFGDGSAISSSTAAWGYVVALGDDLRPIPVCDKGENYLTWVDFWNSGFSTSGQSIYNSYFGRDAALVSSTDPAVLGQLRFPASSNGFINGPTGRNPNNGQPYVVPDGTDGHRTIHRITMPDLNCGTSPGNRLWVDFEDEEGGSAPASVLSEWLEFGYKGTVSLSPHDCNPSNDNPSPEDCGSGPGEKASLEKALQKITCDRLTPARGCPHVFPILVVSEVTSAGGSNAHYVQVAFLYIVMRGFGDLNASNVQIDMEFLDVKTSGDIAGAPPTTTHPYQTGTQLCGVDHDNDSGDGDRCPF